MYKKYYLVVFATEKEFSKSDDTRKLDVCVGGLIPLTTCDQLLLSFVPNDSGIMRTLLVRFYEFDSLTIMLPPSISHSRVQTARMRRDQQLQQLAKPTVIMLLFWRKRPGEDAVFTQLLNIVFFIIDFSIRCQFSITILLPVGSFRPTY